MLKPFLIYRLGLALLLPFFMWSQETSVVKSMIGVQVGTFGGWLHYEGRVTTDITWRAELGVNNVAAYGEYIVGDGVFSPLVTLSGRYYYNLQKRAINSKKTTGNSANFWSLETHFVPNSLLLTKHKTVETSQVLALVPKWGLRRHLGNSFHFEGGIGLGYAFRFDEPDWGILSGIRDLVVDIHLRIGYTF